MLETSNTTGNRPVGPAHVQIVLENSLKDLKRARVEMDRFLEGYALSEKTSYDVHLVFEELVTNVVKYAWEDDRLHEIDLRISIERETVALRVRDDGKPFDPRAAPKPTVPKSLDDATVGGLGIEMIRQTARSIEYSRRGGYNEVEVVMSRVAA